MSALKLEVEAMVTFKQKNILGDERIY